MFLLFYFPILLFYSLLTYLYLLSLFVVVIFCFIFINANVVVFQSAGWRPLTSQRPFLRPGCSSTHRCVQAAMRGCRQAVQPSPGRAAPAPTRQKAAVQLNAHSERRGSVHPYRSDGKQEGKNLKNKGRILESYYF